jgi:hypothetical protein
MNGNEELKLAVYEAVRNDERERASVTGIQMFAEPDRPVMEQAREIIKTKPEFIPNFTPVTTSIIKNGDIDMSGFTLRTQAGEQVNSLIRGEYYIFSYTASFNETVDRLNYGFGIRTEKGVSLTWRIQPEPGIFESKTILPGETYTFKWKFKCLFNPGNYYISITMRTIRGNGDAMVNRIDDVFVFKVAQKADGGGFFDSEIEGEILKTNY